MEDVVMRVEGVSKKFSRRIRHNMLYGTLDVGRGMLGLETRTDRLRAGEFWAVDDVSFELKRGETLGLIGQNGSGKSTLLRLLNGIYQPDKGRIEIKGRVGALIAVGAGFHPLMTGRENIYLNGSILGMTRAEIDNNFDSIVEFADIGDFLDAPVKTYSSGMHVRLGFAIAIHCDPDILLVDEILAVGDFGFRQKCFGRINELRSNATIIFVSHNLRDINMLCDKALVMDSGCAVYAGVPAEAAEHYMDLLMSNGTARTTVVSYATTRRPLSIFGERYYNKERIADVRHAWKDEGGEETAVINNGQKLSLDFSFRLLSPVRNLAIGVPIWDNDGTLITGLSTDIFNIEIKVNKDGLVVGNLVLDRVILNPANYISAFAVVDGNEFLYRDFNKDFKVKNMPVWFGFINHEHRWEFVEG